MPELDPIFALPTPLLFAHRGGAKEVPESTEMAFQHARAVRSDVLELDVNLTRDGEIVVWHGPSLENVRIAVESDEIKKRRRKIITKFDWDELEGQAWVDEPGEKYNNVKHVPGDPNRRLLLLQEFLLLFPEDPINIELKGSFEEDDVAKLVKVLEDFPGKERRILIVSGCYRRLSCVKKKLDRLPPARRSRYALGLSALQALGLRLKAVLPFTLGRGMAGVALQTPYPRIFCPRRLVNKVHKREGAVHVFITGFGPLPGLDKNKGGLDRERLFQILRRGVDGIMTDRPGEVRALLDEWKQDASLG